MSDWQRIDWLIDSLLDESASQQEAAELAETVRRRRNPISRAWERNQCGAPGRGR